MASNLYDLHFCKRKDNTSPRFSLWSYDRVPDILRDIAKSARTVSHTFGYVPGQTFSAGPASKHTIPLYNPTTSEKQVDVWIYPAGSKKTHMQTPSGESRLMMCQFAAVHLVQTAAEFEPAWIREHDVANSLSELTTQFYREMLRANTASTHHRPKSLRDSLILQGEPATDDAGLYNTGAIQGIRESRYSVHITTVQKPFVIQSAFEKLAQEYLAQNGFELRENKSVSRPEHHLFHIYQQTPFSLCEPIQPDERMVSNETCDADGFEPLPFDVPLRPNVVNRIITQTHKAASFTKVGHIVSEQKQIGAGARDYSLTFEVLPRHAKSIANLLPIPHDTLRGPIAKNEVLQIHLRQNFAEYVRNHQDVFIRPTVIDTSVELDDLPF